MKRALDPKTELFRACINGDADSIRRLAPHKIDVNTRNDNQRTPLHEACFHGSLDAVVALLDLGADINAQDWQGCTPLHDACAGNHPEVVQLLMKHGADPNLANVRGFTPLAVACDHNLYSITNQLLLANCEEPSDDPDSASSINVDVNSKDTLGRTPLHLACTGGFLDIGKLLVSKNAAIYVADKGSYDTPLMYACISNREDVVKYLLPLDPRLSSTEASFPLSRLVIHNKTAIVKMLLDGGKDVNTRFADGDTLLHIACGMGYYDMAKMLLKHGAEVNARDTKGRAVLHYAVIMPGNLNILQLLIANGADINAEDEEGRTALHSDLFDGDEAMQIFLLNNGGQLQDREEQSSFSGIKENDIDLSDWL